MPKRAQLANVGAGLASPPTLGAPVRAISSATPASDLISRKTAFILADHLAQQMGVQGTQDPNSDPNAQGPAPPVGATPGGQAQQAMQGFMPGGRTSVN